MISQMVCWARGLDKAAAAVHRAGVPFIVYFRVYLLRVLVDDDTSTSRPGTWLVTRISEKKKSNKHNYTGHC